MLWHKHILEVSFLSTMSLKPSYEGNRNYSKHFNWSYELKRDVYNCYLRAKENPAPGYIERLKSYWDEIYPEFSFLSDKNLRDAASLIDKNKTVTETEYQFSIWHLASTIHKILKHTCTINSVILIIASG